ncbi:DUF2922 domain-containing protein [Oceanotoga sp. DSM 15011]|jgi:hypothetical protein|uniref:DUF2922 domain-containing protein n=1 Tax=Oceanotoga teriensis TaxID=515440 RepID=A0AA45HHH2_9BACT|nr:MULTISPECIES: DUF2922 domain-containing protein [Oceanotoga]MDN5343473.1 hypothetical protein [Oceanotoga sp.]MDO7976499.1 DUF2922 domain-containing protein [Oceanotoga teriensis]PWJ86901.1 hypothetical protein C7380_12815 [Oceanotoga teriensis]UYO99215.1 DUF2922 domain-containing protein [Oceanotoga sp. DSM 15011]
MKKLILKYYNPSEKKRYSTTINNPKEEIESTEVQNVMQTLIGVIVPENAEIDEANIVQTTTTQILNLIE